MRPSVQLTSDVSDMSSEAYAEFNTSLKALTGIAVCEHSLNFDGFLPRRLDLQPSSCMWRFALMQISPDASDRPVARNVPGDGANGFLRSISIYLPYYNVTSKKNSRRFKNSCILRVFSYLTQLSAVELPTEWVKRSCFPGV